MTPSGSGYEVFAEFFGVDRSLLLDAIFLNDLFMDALKKTGFTILEQATHTFPTGGNGVTGMFLLSESHACFHTYPEWGTIVVNIFSCGKSDPQKALDIIRTALNPATVEQKNVLRHFRR